MAETVGTLCDKLSITELKIFHMELQTRRTDAAPDHLEKCKARLSILQEQKADLAQELNELMDAVMAGTKKIKVYRQFKMYNNPIYKTKASA